ncbi:phosphotransferase enzyme family protein [Flavobacterium sp. RHBU_3]|uniref:phosphotransferase enzyme family protein n=1 Tax=Flavobacterium sp. RHBU_3 TaxID=3391184 RepID=UPI00398542C7
MNLFPTQYSVLKADAVGSYIAHMYGFTVTECKLLIHNVSDTYIVETPETKYIFKIYRDSHRPEAEIRSEAELLTAFKDNGASVVYTLPNIYGDMLTAFKAAEGQRFGMLFTFAQGAPVYDLCDTQLKLLGTEMAKLHIISSKAKLKHARREYNIDTMLRIPLQVIAPDFEQLPEEYAYLKETTAYVITELEKLPLQDFPTGYCQYDFLPKNFHFSGEDKITFFDFDFAGKGHLINDITTFYIHYFFDVMTGKRTREEADRCFKVFLEAYRSVRPVSDTEISSMKLFGLGFFMFYFGFHHENFDDWSNFFYTERFIKERVSVIKKWMAYAPLPL